jgi:superfamily II DNA or RNA helicase
VGWCTDLSADALHASLLVGLVDELALFSPRTRERGRRYAAAGHVGAVKFEGSVATAPVRGGELYYTSWHWRRPHGWEALCTCPVGGFCKHAYALACVVLEGARQQGFADPRLADLLPPRATVPDRARPRAGAVAAPGAADLQRLRAARAEWERQGALDHLLVGAPVLGLSPYAPPLLDLLREPDADLRCWRVAGAIAARADGWVPAALQRYSDRPDLEQRFLDRERAALAAELLGWANSRSDIARRLLRVVFAVEPLADGAAALVFEVRVSTPRLADAPRTPSQLQTLRAESLRDPGLFPPEHAAVLEWVADHAVVAGGPTPGGSQRLTTGTPLALLERVASSPLAAWADALDPVLAERGGITPGGSVHLSAGAARLVPDCVSRDGTPSIELHFRWPDGRQRRLDEVIYIPGSARLAGRRGSLVLADGALAAVADEPPPALLERFRTVGALPLEAEQRAEFVGALATRFTHLHDTLTAHSRVHPAVLSVAFDLRPDDWLQVRVFAQSGAAPWQPGGPVADGAVLFEHAPDRGWVGYNASQAAQPAEPIAGDRAAGSDLSTGDASTTPPGASAPADQSKSTTTDTAVASADRPGESGAANDIWIEMPDPEAAAPVLDWLRVLPLTSGRRATGGHESSWPDRNVGWWMRASRRTMEQLGAAWEERPATAAYFGTNRVRRLLGGGRGIAPRLRVAASGVDWLAVSAQWDAEGRQLTDADLARLREATTRFVKLDSGWVRKEVGDEQEELAAALADLGIEADGGEQRLSVWQLVGASPATLQRLERVGGDAETLATLGRLRERIAAFTGIPSVPVPAGVTAALRPYQRHGLDFLAHAATLGIGAVLADDMGLGKTVQALAWLVHQRACEPDGGPTLVVCPASVVHNWAREAERFTPGLRVLLLTSGKTRHALREAIPEHDLVVTTYALLRRDIEAWRDVALRAAILDEAQFIKNPDAAVSRAALELRARHRLALTGTPLENRALDLWSILAFVAPGYLGSRGDFSARYDRADAPPHTRALLAAKLRPVLLRRTKRAVAPELPPRIEERRDCELTAEQRQLYVGELQRSRTLLAQASEAPGGLARNKITILAALTRLRQICCHPALAGGRADLGSGKFDALFELLEPLLAEGHKVLVFSQFVRCLNLLATALRARGLTYHRLTGQTTKREQVVAAFQNDPDPCVFLISLKAGGTGLNLTAASYVVLFDPWWNPAVEAQAIDRTHRIGQDRTVIAYRLISRGTIEEKIYDLQQRKAALVRDVLGESGFARTLTRDDLEFLLADA